MIGIGIADLFRLKELVDAMASLQMPEYLLLILGFSKLIGGLLLIIKTKRDLKLFALHGFWFWALGGMACHYFAGHSFSDYIPLITLTIFLSLTHFFLESYSSQV